MWYVVWAGGCQPKFWDKALIREEIHLGLHDPEYWNRYDIPETSPNIPEEGRPELHYDEILKARILMRFVAAF